VLSAASPHASPSCSSATLRGLVSAVVVRGIVVAIERAFTAPPAAELASA
jgi:hypothetical protein